MSKTFRKDPFTRETVPEKENKPYKLNRVKSWKLRDNLKYHEKKDDEKEADERSSS